MLWGQFPNCYTKNAADFYNFFPTICPFDEGCLLSYQRDHELHLYNSQTPVKTVGCKSKYIKDFMAYPDDKMYDMAHDYNYQVSQPKYADLIYDQYAEKFYRVAIHAKDITANGKLVADSDPTWSIIVMSKDLSVEKEVLLHQREYDPAIVFPVKEGLIVKKTPTTTVGHLTLAILKL